MKQLTRSELQIMKYLWKIKKGYMKDIVEQFPEPAPAYTTVSTLVGRMVDKKYIGFEKHGRDKEYYPLLQKNEYFGSQLKGMMSDFFNNSTSQFASFFTRNADLSLEELKELEELVQEKIAQKRK